MTVPASQARSDVPAPRAPSDVPAPPVTDADVSRFLEDLGVPGIVDVHVHFLPENVLRKVWGYFDQAQDALRDAVARALPAVRGRATGSPS